MSLDTETVKKMTPPMLRKTVREHLKVDPMTLGNGDPDQLRKALLDSLKPAAGKNGKAAPKKGGGKAAAPAPVETPAAQPSVLPDDVGKGWPRDLREFIASIMLRLGTIEAHLGVSAGSKDMPPSPLSDDYAELRPWMQTHPETGEDMLRMEVKDVDLLNEKQTHLLASLLDEPIVQENKTPLPPRVLKNRLKQRLSDLFGKQGAPPPAPAGQQKPKPGAAPAEDWKAGDLVKVNYNGEVHEPTRIVFIKGKQFMAHYGTDETCDMAKLTQIVGRSTKPWKLDQLTEEDFADW